MRRVLNRHMQLKVARAVTPGGVVDDAVIGIF